MSPMPQRTPEERKAYHADYYVRNRDRLAAQSADYRARHREEIRRQHAAWYQKNKARENQKNRAWQLAHPDRNRELAAASKRRHADRVVMEVEFRRALKRSLTIVPITLEGLNARRRFVGERCWMCGAREVPLVWDHVKPLARGGLHVLANLRLACSPCNCSKHARWWGIARLPELVRAVVNRRT